MIELTEEEAVTIDTFVREHSLIQPVISVQNLCSINSCPDQQMYRARIQYLFQVDAYVVDENGNYNSDAKEILIDLFHDAILYAADNSFTYAKSIVFLTIFVAILQQVFIIEHFDQQYIYGKYEKCILIHSVDRPPKAFCIFDLPDVKIIHNFFIGTFFRNLKMISNCFTKKPIIKFSIDLPFSLPPSEISTLSEMEIITEQKVHIEPQPLQIETPHEEETKIKTSKKLTKSPYGSKSSFKDIKVEKHSKTSSKDLMLNITQMVDEETHSPDVPMDILREVLTEMHEKFVSDFDEKERLLIGKIKELEIRMAEKQATIPVKKSPTKTPKK